MLSARQTAGAALMTLLLLLALGCTAPAGSGDDDDDGLSTPRPQLLEAESGSLTTVNAAGRFGSYYLPARDSDQPVPLLVGFHATGGDGQGFLAAFAAHAQARGFAIVAPDSRISPAGDATWEVGTEPAEITPDYTHALRCIDELRDQHGLLIDTTSVLTAGYSGGASSAPYLASNELIFTAFAVLHGGVFAGGIGQHITPGWFSTGEDDSLRSPAHVQAQLDSLVPLGFDELELHIFAGGHGLSGEETEALIAWWLGSP